MQETASRGCLGKSRCFSLSALRTSVGYSSLGGVPLLYMGSRSSPSLCAPPAVTPQAGGTTLPVGPTGSSLGWILPAAFTERPGGYSSQSSGRNATQLSWKLLHLYSGPLSRPQNVQAPDPELRPAATRTGRDLGCPSQAPCFSGERSPTSPLRSLSVPSVLQHQLRLPRAREQQPHRMPALSNGGGGGRGGQAGL